jgi:hypothetical protein
MGYKKWISPIGWVIRETNLPQGLELILKTHHSIHKFLILLTQAANFNFTYLVKSTDHDLGWGWGVILLNQHNVQFVKAYSLQSLWAI